MSKYSKNAIPKTNDRRSMNRLQKLINPYINKSETDNHMTTILKEKFDNDLKSRYADILENKYNLTRKAPVGKTKKMYPWIGIAAATAAILVMALTFLNQNPSTALNHSQLALNYVEQNPLQTANITRGADVNKMSTAYQNLEEGKFKEALIIFESEELTAKEDIFYMAYAQFKSERYSDASENFSKVASMTESADYLSEARLHSILSLYADNKVEKAQKETSSLDPTSWEFMQLEKLY